MTINTVHRHHGDDHGVTPSVIPLSTSRNHTRTRFCILCIVTVVALFVSFITVAGSSLFSLPSPVPSSVSSTSTDPDDSAEHITHISYDRNHRASLHRLRNTGASIFSSSFDLTTNPSAIERVSTVTSKQQDYFTALDDKNDRGDKSFQQNDRYSAPQRSSTSPETVTERTLSHNLTRLKLSLPHIESFVTHQLDLLAAYRNSAEAGAPSSCSPTLTSGQFFPESFADSYHTLPPLQYRDAIKERNSSKVWLTARIDPLSNNDDIVQRTRMTDYTSSRFCQNLRYFRPDHVPTEGCHNEVLPLPPTYNYPWCFPPTDPVHIMSIDCGIVENYIVHEDIAFTLYTDKFLVATNRARWHVHSHIPVTEYDELATISAAEYPTEPGHFPNEDLHSLLFLDYALPGRIPLLWPNGSIALHILESLQEEKVLNPERKIILVGPRHEQSYYRAKRLYYFRSNRGWNQSPYISWYGQRFVQQLLFPVIERRLRRTVTDAERKLSIVVVKRHDGARMLTNHNELVERLKRWIPDAIVHDFNPTPNLGFPMWKTAERVYSSCLLIGPHGGNLSNEIYLPSGCWVIEIGFMDPAFHLPPDFYCFSRNLGHVYWLSIGNGTYADPLTADLDDIETIVRQYKREMLGRKE